MAQNKSLSTQEVADMLHVSKSTIYDLIRREEINSYKIGRKVRFTQEDVDAYIARSRHEQSTRPIRKVDVESTFLNPEDEKTGLIISGQDVLLDILAGWLRQRGVNASRCYLSGFEGLLSLYQEKISVTACHLYSGEDEDYNVAYVRMLMPGIPAAVINLSYRNQGFYVARGNPKQILTWHDLSRQDVRIINRRAGSASRILLDHKLKENGISSRNVSGYESIMQSHLSLAEAIASGEADVGIGTERVSRKLDGLDFIPLIRERMDLVVRKDVLDTPEMTMLLDVLRDPAFHRDIRNISGNDCCDIGRIVAEV